MSMELPSLDLNLLVALHALLSERNVTRAGERIGLSQPATSAALARLRRHFGDQLLERVGSRYQLTPLAAGLLEQSGVALRHVEHTFAARPVFDALDSTREFILIASDYALTVIGAQIAELLQQRGPDVRLRIRSLDQHLVDDAGTTLRSVDAMVLPSGYLNDLPGRLLFEDDWVILTRRDPSAARDATGRRVLELGDLTRARWVVTYDAPTQFTPPDKTMSLLGIERHADIVVENFASMPYLVAGGNRLGLLPRRLAARFEGFGDVEQIDVPVGLPPLSEHVWWHPSHSSDPGHRWLIGLVVLAAARATGTSATSAQVIGEADEAHPHL